MPNELSYRINEPVPVPTEKFPCFAILIEPFSIFEQVLVMFVTCKTGFILGSRKGGGTGHAFNESRDIYTQPARWKILPAGTNINLDITV